jgi:hypothetical protein
MNPIYITLIIIGVILILIGGLLSVAITQLKYQIKRDDLEYLRALIAIRDRLIDDLDCYTLLNSWNRLKYYGSKDTLVELSKTRLPDDPLVLAAERIFDRAFKAYEESLDHLSLLLAIETRILTIETHLKFQALGTEFRYVTIANKYYTQLDHAKRDLEALIHEYLSISEPKLEEI